MNTEPLKLQTRRHFFGDCGVGIGKIALASLLAERMTATGLAAPSPPENPTFTYYAARIAEKRGRYEAASEWYRGILKALDILRPTYRCRDCEAEGETYADRCPACGRWGSVSLDIGVKPLTTPLPAAHPVYAVRGEEPELDEEPPPVVDVDEEQGRG